MRAPALWLLIVQGTGPPDSAEPRGGGVREWAASYQGAAARVGAGEGIRTLGPNLGKVVLYP